MNLLGQHGLEMADFCRAMVDASPMPMIFLVGNGHTIRYVNPAFCVLVGEHEQELVGSSFPLAVAGADECLALLNRVLRTRQAETHIGKEGSPSDNFYWSYIIWPVLSADDRLEGVMIQVTETTPFHMQAVAMNQALLVGSVRQHELTEAADALNVQLQAEIVQRKHAEEEMERQQGEIRESEQRFRGLIEAIPQVVWTATPQGELDFVNTKWMDCFAIDRETFNREGWSALLHPDDLTHALEAWSAGLQSESAFQIECRLRNVSSGNFRWYFTRAVPIGGAGESVLKWFGTITDVDDRKRAEMALFAKQKFESLGLLAGGIAHDFNNLLCVILGGAGLIENSLPKSHPLRGTILDITQASERAAHLTRQMLAYAGKGRFLVESIDVNELVQSTCGLIKASVPRSVHLTVQARPGLPPVQADSGQIQQVVMNLVLNAAEAIDETIGGSVIVKTDLVDIDASTAAQTGLLTGTLAPGPYVVVEVLDNGSGMDESTKAKILEPFFTTKFTGRGLGLAAVGGILRTQSGSMEVRSKLGEGSTFRVYLPASQPLSRPQEVPAQHPKERGQGTILIVDDEEMIRKIAKQSLEEAGYTILLAGAGEEALRILRSQAGALISLIILDLSMPEMSGRQVMQSIRRAGISIPILICSGFSEAEIDKEFSGLDIAGVIPKPFTLLKLAEQVRAALSLNEKPRT